MAKVLSINVSSIKTEYWLEDETGKILGVAWRDGVRISYLSPIFFFNKIDWSTFANFSVAYNFYGINFLTLGVHPIKTKYSPRTAVQKTPRQRQWWRTRSARWSAAFATSMTQRTCWCCTSRQSTTPTCSPSTCSPLFTQT